MAIFTNFLCLPEPRYFLENFLSIIGWLEDKSNALLPWLAPHNNQFIFVNDFISH